MINQSAMFRNTLFFGVIFLLIGVIVQPGIASVHPEEETYTEHKDYLFRTILDIADNQDVKNLLNRYNHKTFTSDYKYIGVFFKIFFNNPRLLPSFIFSKHTLTYEYLQKYYNKGIEITRILGEGETLEMIESIKVRNKDVICELKTIITTNEELSNRLANLKEMNEIIKPDTLEKDYLIICGILTIVISPIILLAALIEYFNNYNLISIFFMFIFVCVASITGFPFIIIYSIGDMLGCWEFT
jgi:hypothetical protein